MAVAKSNTASTSGASGGTNTTTYTGVAIGAAASDRQVWVGICNLDLGGLSSLVTGVTIGGVAATIESSTRSSDGAAFETFWCWAAVPTGTTANIVITCSAGSTNESGISVYRVVGADTTSPLQAGDADTEDNFPVGITVPVDGALLGFATVLGDGTTTSTWSGALTEDADFRRTTVLGFVAIFTSASGTTAGATSASVTWSSELGPGRMSLAAIKSAAPAADTLTNQTLRFM